MMQQISANNDWICSISHNEPPFCFCVPNFETGYVPWYSLYASSVPCPFQRKNRAQPTGNFKFLKQSSLTASIWAPVSTIPSILRPFMEIGRTRLIPSFLLVFGISFTWNIPESCSFCFDLSLFSITSEEGSWFLAGASGTGPNTAYDSVVTENQPIHKYQGDRLFVTGYPALIAGHY